MKIFHLSPPRILVIGFLGTILLASLLLWLPISHEPGVSLTYGEALFTATSAITVTGLNVIDPGTTFNRFGEILLIIFIQIGGLGFMTFAIWLFVLLGKKISLRQRLLMQENTNQTELQGIVRLAVHLLWITLGFELIGAIILTLRWQSIMGLKEAAFQGVFHAVSAFNNAGFSLFSNGLMGDVNDPTVNLAIIVLILLGGIGFTVILDILNKKFVFRRFSLHTKVTLTTNLIMIVFGTIVFFLLEFWNGASIGTFPLGTKILSSFFQTVTTRTAGFNTLDIGALSQGTLVFFSIYMFIGSASGSTGGGVKVTTIAIMWAAVKSILMGKEDTVLFKRRIPLELVLRSMTIIILSLIIVVSIVLALDITEKGTPFIALLFETVSAFGTVGLSMGITPELSQLGRIIIMITMFIGRLGPLTIGFALAKKKEKEHFKYPEEKMMIG